jgi:uncharacterized protein YdhG (YjbR/CyaY superfamily)
VSADAKSPRPRARKASRPEAITEEERAALRDWMAEKRGKVATDGDAAVLAKIAEMGPADRALAERLHALIQRTAPQLQPRLWYGMPAYSLAGAVVCFFQPREKFKARYATLGFSDKAHLDDGAMWPTVYAIAEWTDGVADRITDLLRRAVSPDA